MSTKNLIFLLPIFVAFILKVIISTFVWFRIVRKQKKEHPVGESSAPKVTINENTDPHSENTDIASADKNDDYGIVPIIPRPAPLSKSRSFEGFAIPIAVERQISESKVVAPNPDYGSLTDYSSKINNDYCNLPVIKHN